MRFLQPQSGPLQLDRKNPLGAVLDNVWLGNDLAGRSIGGGIVAPPPAGTSITPGVAGKALANTGNFGSLVAIPTVSSFPWIQIGLGFFNSAAGNWELSGLGSSGGGYSSAIHLDSSTSVQLVLRFNYGTTQTLPLTVGSGVGSGRLLCAIAQVFSPTDYRLYCAGVQANGSTSLGAIGAGFDRIDPPGYYLNGGLFLTGYGAGRSLSDAQALQITRDPQRLWEIFQQPGRRIFLPAAGGASHGASGALTADAATLSGIASRTHAHAATGALAADPATLSGTAGRTRVHAGSGALAADTAAISGTASRTRVHAGAGALAADAATIAGSAARAGAAVTHAASGALAAGSAAIAGTASRTRVHAGAGALAADVAAIAGTASRTRVHAGAGALAADAATITGTASRTHVHAATGTLLADAASLAGSAARSGVAVTHAASGALVAGAATLSGWASLPTLAGGGGRSLRARRQRKATRPAIPKDDDDVLLGFLL